MTIDIAILELYNLVKNNPDCTPEQVESINTVIEWINNAKHSHLDNNKLFAKLYIISFNHAIQHYNDITFAQKEIHKQLSEPVENHAFWLKETINLKEYNSDGSIKKWNQEAVNNAINNQISEAINKFSHYD